MGGSNFITRIYHKLQYYHYSHLHAKYRAKTGLELSPNCAGAGLHISHGKSVVSSIARLGEHCKIFSDVTIGGQGRYDVPGAPTIGNQAFIASGAKVIGPITIADGVVIGANAVVTRDILEPNTTWAGIPARKVSDKGSIPYLRKELKQLFLGSQYRFITSYVGLVLLPPVLNGLLDMPLQRVRLVLFSMLAYVLIYGWLISDYIHIPGGYSLLWFVVLYIAAGYLRRTADKYKIRHQTYLVIYLFVSLLSASLAFLCLRYQLPIKLNKFYDYTSPLVFIASAGLFLSFINRPSGGENYKQICYIMSGYLSYSL